MQALIAKRIRGTVLPVPKKRPERTRGTVLPVHAQPVWLVRPSGFGQNSTFAIIILTQNSVLGGILVCATITLPKTPKAPAFGQNSAAQMTEKPL